MSRVLRFILGALLAACASVEGEPPAAPGQACDPARSHGCRGGFCLELRPGAGVCSSTCARDLDCPANFHCAVEERLQAKVCKPGERCADDSSCPAGHRCDRQRGACFLPVERDLCSPCTADGQCPAGGLCVEARATGERFCSRPCEEPADCPAGYLCRELVQGGVSYDGIERPRQCLPAAESCHARKPLCAPCVGDWECGDGGDRCLENLLTGERFCGKACNPDCVWDSQRGSFVDTKTGRRCESACPQNTSCLDLSAGGVKLFQCVPNSHTCEGACSANDMREERIQCGPGRACDRASRQCGWASDGRGCAPCLQDGDCASGAAGPGSRCIANASSGESFCAAPCEDDQGCREAMGVGFVCRAIEGEPLCVPESGSCAVGILPLGSACDDGGASCAGGICLQRDGKGFCSAPCWSDEHCVDARYQCCAMGEAGWDCEGEPGPEGGLCLPKGGRFGEDCEPGRPPCLDGFCLDIGGARVCTAACDSDLACDRVSGKAGAFQCRQAQGLDASGKPGDPVDVCFPAGGGEVGSDCSFGPAACADRVCLKRERGNLCSKPCTGGDCPAGWHCAPATTVDGQSIQTCLPRSAVEG